MTREELEVVHKALNDREVSYFLQVDNNETLFKEKKYWRKRAEDAEEALAAMRADIALPTVGYLRHTTTAPATQVCQDCVDEEAARDREVTDRDEENDYDA